MSRRDAITKRYRICELGRWRPSGSGRRSRKTGDLNASIQHQLEVYFAEFKRLNRLAGIDSKKTPS
jgi:hypothetical protein